MTETPVTPDAVTPDAVTPDAVTPDPATTDPSYDDAGGRPVLTAVLATLVGLLVVASLVLGLLLGRHLSARRDAEQARGDALASGRQAILNLDALSVTTISRDLARVVAGSTGVFRDSFVKSEKDLLAIVKERKTMSTGTVLSAGVVRADADTATVLVAVDRSIRDTTTRTAVIAHDRWRMSMELHGGRWLLADLRPVS